MIERGRMLIRFVKVLACKKYYGTLRQHFFAVQLEMFFYENTFVAFMK